MLPVPEAKIEDYRRMTANAGHFAGGEALQDARNAVTLRYTEGGVLLAVPRQLACQRNKALQLYVLTLITARDAEPW